MIRLARLVPVLIALSVGLPPIVSAQSDAFEGVVAYKMSGSGDNAEMTQMYKGTKSRTEINSKGQSAAMIMDLATGTKRPSPVFRKIFSRSVGSLTGLVVETSFTL